MSKVVARHRSIILVMAWAMTGCASVPNASGPLLPPGAQYVAMGSSFAAGPGLGSPKTGTPARCTRDEHNYATLLAQRLSLQLVDVTCGGATTNHILAQWDELPPQMQALTAVTQLVTVTIGGNDVGFVGNLFAASCDPAAAPQPCRPTKLPTEEDWAKLESNLREIGRQVHARAPNARVVFVDYLTLIPERGTCAALRMSQENALSMRRLGARLAEVTARVARDIGADLVPAGELSQGHTPCAEQPWSMGAPGTGPGAPWNPNAAGMLAVADALAMRLMKP